MPDPAFAARFLSIDEKSPVRTQCSLEPSARPEASCGRQRSGLTHLPGLHVDAPHTSEKQLNAELDQSWRACAGDPAEIHAVSGVRVRLAEIGVIEGVEQFGAEYQTRLFARYREEFLEAQVPILQARTVQHVAPGVAEGADRRNW